MPISTSIFVALGLLLFATVGYCLAVWHAVALLSTLVDPRNAPALFQFIAPLPLSVEYIALHFQAIALTSLLGNGFWLYRQWRSGKHGISQPVLLHTLLLLGLTFLNIAGALAPMVTVIYVIG